ncbi:hypothetical protein BJP24_19950 [Aeromonas allosaccharophila]|uniref:glycosyltransferase family 4 protein n=1 Tax=Aeromonas allosaccharophila TaxID=656 RepID=UPI0009643202|nr:glycosyltransferase family 4 protein [Aeromonas allosaccharophila]OKP42008.1 hypothetical protein BJP24_19950 [Aeromonas allosaccharophila]
MKYKEINIAYPYIKKSGGMETYVIDLIDGMTKLGVKVNVITMYVDPSILFDKSLVTFSLFKMPLINNFKLLRDKAFDFFCMKKKIDGVPTISCCRHPSGAEVAISAGTHVANRVSLGKKIYRLSDFLSIWQEKKGFLLSAHVVAHSRSIADELVRYYQIPSDKISVLYPPTNSDVFKRKTHFSRSDYRHLLGIAENEIAMLFPSGNHFRKGADIILSALNCVDKRIKLIVAGSKKIEHERVINVGFIDDMPSLYSAVDATILASRYEPFGLVAIESVLCGTPVVLSASVAATEVLHEGMCFKFDLNKDSLVDALNKIIYLWDSGEYNEFKLQMPEPKMDSLDEHCIKLLDLAYGKISFVEEAS